MHTIRTCTLRKGVGVTVRSIEDVGRCPVEDYITSLLLCTSVQGNLADPLLQQCFPFLSLPPLCRQLQINWGFWLFGNLHTLNPTANPIRNNEKSLSPEEFFAESICTFPCPQWLWIYRLWFYSETL